MDNAAYFMPYVFLKKFDELPLGTGDFIPSEKFTRIFSNDAQLVYLAKAWALETRIWQSHFPTKIICNSFIFRKI